MFLCEVILHSVSSIQLDVNSCHKYIHIWESAYICLCIYKILSLIETKLGTLPMSLEQYSLQVWRVFGEIKNMVSAKIKCQCASKILIVPHIHSLINKPFVLFSLLWFILIFKLFSYCPLPDISSFTFILHQFVFCYFHFVHISGLFYSSFSFFFSNSLYHFLLCFSLIFLFLSTFVIFLYFFSILK